MSEKVINFNAKKTNINQLVELAKAIMNESDGTEAHKTRNGYSLIIHNNILNYGEVHLSPETKKDAHEQGERMRLMLRIKSRCESLSDRELAEVCKTLNISVG